MFCVFCSYRFWTTTQKRKKSFMVLPLFRTQSLFLVLGWQVWHLSPLSYRTRSAARSEVVTVVEESPSGSAVMLQGGWGEERHSKQSLALWKINVWDPQDNLVLYLQKLNWCLQSHLALNQDFSQRKCSSGKFPIRRDVLFHQIVNYFTLK